MVEMWSTIPYNASLVDQVDLIVSPQHLAHVKSYLSCSGMEPEVVEDNLQRAIDEENQEDPDQDIVITRQSGKGFFVHLIRFKKSIVNWKQQNATPPSSDQFLDPYHIIQKRGTFGDLLGLFDQDPSKNVRSGRNSRPPPVVQNPKAHSGPHTITINYSVSN